MSYAVCAICREPHKDPILGGKVIFLRHCWKSGRSYGKFMAYRTRKAEQEKKAALLQLQNAVDSFGRKSPLVNYESTAP